MSFTNRLRAKSAKAVRRAVSHGLESLENRRLFAVVDVANFGAAVNDGRDDSGSIQAAINASKPGDTVSFRQGTYNISNQLVAKTGRTLEGNGANVHYNGGGGKYAFVVEADSSNTTIQNFRLKGAGIGLTLGSFLRNTKVLNNEINGTAGTHGIHATVPSDGTIIEGNYIHDFDHWGFIMFSNSNSRIDNNVIRNVKQGGQVVNPNRNNSVSGNVVTGLNRMGFEIQQTYGLGTANGTFDLFVNNNVIWDWASPWYDSFALSIMPQLGQNVQVKNNYLKASRTGPFSAIDAQGRGRYGFGLELGYTTGIADNNTFVGPWYAGVASSAVNATVSNNKFYGLGGFTWGGSPSVYGSGSVNPINNFVSKTEAGAPGVPSWALAKLANPLSGVSAPVVTTPAPTTPAAPVVTTPAPTAPAVAAPAVVAPAASGATVPSGAYTWVSDLNPTFTRNGWGVYEKNRSNGEQGAADGRPITIQNVTYTKGLGVHANSELTYALGGKFANFSSEIGMDDEVGAAGSVEFEVWADGAKLYASGTIGGNTASKSVSVDVSGKQSLTLKVNGLGAVDSDHADWAFARLTAATGAAPATPAPAAPVVITPAPSTPAPAGGTFLSDLPIVSSKNGWGPIELNGSVGEYGRGDGNTISIDGLKYDKGIGMHADAEAVFALNKKYTKFFSDVGVDDEVGSSGTVVFQVWGDGKLLYDSGKVAGHSGEKSVNLDITGIATLKLITTGGGDGIQYDHASWGGTKVS